MEQDEAQNYLKKKVRLVLSNTYRFTGLVIAVTSDTILINDKFEKRVSLRLKDIMSCEVLE
ncbi:MAG: hypothetical protein ABIH28_00510 [archaeon]